MNKYEQSTERMNKWLSNNGYHTRGFILWEKELSNSRLECWMTTNEKTSERFMAIFQLYTEGKGFEMFIPERAITYVGFTPDDIIRIGAEHYGFKIPELDAEQILSILQQRFEHNGFTSCEEVIKVLKSYGFDGMRKLTEEEMNAN